MVRKTLTLVAVAAAVGSAGSVAQASSGPASGPEAQAARCTIYVLGPLVEARQRMNQAKGSIAYNTKQVAKYKKAVKNAKSKKAAKKAAKNLKSAKTELKDDKGRLPGLVKRFNERNAKAVEEGCTPDDGKPKGRRG